MTKIELIIKVKRLEADCKAYNFTQHELQEEVKDLKQQNTDLEETINKLREQLSLRYDLEDKIKELEAQNKELRCCANCNNSYGGEEEPQHDCGYCHAMQCICKLKLEEHTSDIYRMWEDKCERWEMRIN